MTAVDTPETSISSRNEWAGAQTTIGAPIKIEGPGMHTGANTRVRILPARADTGILFTRGAVRIPARAAFVVGTRRCTSLGADDARIDTVEHLLSALHGLQIDNAVVEVDGPEIPILDGSARLWVGAFRDAGRTTLDAPCVPLTLSAPLALRDGDSWILATPASAFQLTCVTAFDHPLLGTQIGTFDADPAFYAEQIAPARTFGFIEEVEALLAAGLAQGGSLENALIVHPDRFSDALRVPDECLRHKALDLWGDLYLVGARLQVAITAIKPGHRINAAFAALLTDHTREKMNARH